SGAGGLGGGFLAGGALDGLALGFVGDALGVCHGSSFGTLKMCSAGRLETFELGELLDKLLHAVTTKLYGKLGVFAFAFAGEDDSFTVFGVADAGSFAEAGAACGGRDVHFGAAGKA